MSQQLKGNTFARFKGNKCPYCGSKMTEAIGPMDVGDDGTAEQYVRCVSCCKKWHNQYKLVDYKPKKPEENK